MEFDDFKVWVYYFHFIDEDFKLKAMIVIKPELYLQVKPNVISIKASWNCIHFDDNHDTANLEYKQLLFFWEPDLIFIMSESENDYLIFKHSGIMFIALKECRNSDL